MRTYRRWSSRQDGGHAQARRSRVNCSPSLGRCGVLDTPCTQARHPGDRSHPFAVTNRNWNNPQLSIWVALACHILAAPTRDGMVQHGVGIAIIGALAYNMGAGPGGCPAAAAARFRSQPGTWQPRDWGTLLHCGHTPPDWQTGAASPASQPAGRTKIPSAACPAVDLGTFLLDPARPQPSRKDRGPWPTTLSCSQYGVPQYSAFDPSFVRRDGSGASAILLGLLRQ